jgi:Icc-related predicted phosphoesterase
MSEGTVKVAALGDLHVGHAGSYAELFKQISSEADVLLLCGDLTNIGSPEQAQALAGDLKALTIPALGVLGNHDHEAGHLEELEKILSDAGLKFLESNVEEVKGVGFAGVKGFGGGFGRFMLGAFGEQATKNFVDVTMQEAVRLENALHQLIDRERVVVALHYSPIAGTVTGEPVEIFAYLGSTRLEETIDRFENVKAIFHGHAHHGTFEGKTGKGAPVFNCSRDVLAQVGKKYVLIEV